MPHYQQWNWQQKDWPDFRYDGAKLEKAEAEFLHQSGVFIGTVRHVSEEDKQQITFDLISDEALYTSEIEGEILDRASLQSSIRRNFGLVTDNHKIPPAEQGIAEMMVNLYQNFDAPLSDSLLFRWHQMLMNGRDDLKDIGGYRTGEAPMQVVSGPIHKPKVHFEAPPAHRLQSEMTQFIEWFNETGPKGKNPLPALTRAGLAHWHFVIIHPFEDGNGRIARTLAEKAMAQCLGHSTLIALSHAINNSRKTYYDALERNNKGNEIIDWLSYFAQTALKAQSMAQSMVNFLIDKTKFFDRFRDQLNERQKKTITRMFREGPNGFQGGLSAEKYIRITGTSRATATRDLQDLVDKEALTRTGTLKSTRYHLCIESKP